MLGPTDELSSHIQEPKVQAIRSLTPSCEAGLKLKGAVLPSFYEFNPFGPVYSIYMLDYFCTWFRFRGYSKMQKTPRGVKDSSFRYEYLCEIEAAFEIL